MACEKFYIEQWDTTFVIPAKVASTSIKQAIIDSLNPEDPRKWFADCLIEDRLPENHKGRIIAFVRNPYSRLVSCFHSKIAVSRRPYKGHPINCRTKFHGFIKYITSLPPEEANVHWSPHYLDINPSYEVYKFENLNESWQEIRKTLPLTDLRRMNKAYKKRDYRECYTDSLVGRVVDYYRKDFDNFNYGYKL